MVLFKRKRVTAVKVETASGTPETLSASDAEFNIYDAVINETVNVTKRESQGSFDRLKASAGTRSGVATFKTDVAWDGTATLPTWATVLFPCCGYVNSAGAFTPRSEAPGSNVKTATIGVYSDGKRKQLSGAAGTFRLVMPAGERAFIEWTFTGSYDGETAQTLLSPTYPDPASEVAIRFASATLTYDSVAAKVAEASLDAGNQVVLREDGTTASGYCGAIVADREPMFRMNPEAVLIATQDRNNNWLSEDEAAISVVLDGPSTSDITIAIPKAQIMNAPEGEREGMLTDELEFMCNKNGSTADEDVTITFNETV